MEARRLRFARAASVAIVMAGVLPLAAGMVAAATVGDFVWPATGTITQNCAQHRASEGLCAEDVANSAGTSVRAAYDGVVTFAGTTNDVIWCSRIGQYVGGGGFGNFVVVKHNWGNGITYYTLYGHLASWSASAGQAVGQGQQVGLMGSTGCSTGPHVHFEVGTCLSGVYVASSCSLWNAPDPSDGTHVTQGAGVGWSPKPVPPTPPYAALFLAVNWPGSTVQMESGTNWAWTPDGTPPTASRGAAVAQAVYENTGSSTWYASQFTKIPTRIGTEAITIRDETTGKVATGGENHGSPFCVSVAAWKGADAGKDWINCERPTEIDGRQKDNTGYATPGYIAGDNPDFTFTLQAPHVCNWLVSETYKPVVETVTWMGTPTPALGVHVRDLTAPAAGLDAPAPGAIEPGVQPLDTAELEAGSFPVVAHASDFGTGVARVVFTATRVLPPVPPVSVGPLAGVGPVAAPSVFMFTDAHATAPGATGTYAWTWEVLKPTVNGFSATAVLPGQYDLTATAYDPCGNHATTPAVTVTVV